MLCPHMVASSSVRRSGIRSVSPKGKPSEYSTLWRVSPAASAALRASSVSPLTLIDMPRSRWRSSARSRFTFSMSSKTAATVPGLSHPSVTSPGVPAAAHVHRAVLRGDLEEGLELRQAALAIRLRRYGEDDEIVPEALGAPVAVQGGRSYAS